MQHYYDMTTFDNILTVLVLTLYNKSPLLWSYTKAFIMKQKTQEVLRLHQQQLYMTLKEQRVAATIQAEVNYKGRSEVISLSVNQLQE